MSRQSSETRVLLECVVNWSAAQPDITVLLNWQSALK
jgi:hypothetical protein